MTLVAADPLIEGWRLAQKRRGLRPTTITYRLRHVSRLKAYMEDRDLTLTDTTHEDIERFLDRCKHGPKSRYNYLSSYATFYKWALREGLVEENPAVDIDRPKLPHYLPRPTDSEELAIAIELAPMPLRAWLMLGAYMGFRCAEIAGLQWPDVLDTSRPPMILVSEGKGQRQRLVPLHGEVAQALRSLPAKKMIGRTGYVFVRDSGARFYPHDISHQINLYLHGLGIATTAHSLRHWFATNVYRSTHDLRLVQSLLGHASPTTTAVYTAFDPGEGVEAVFALSARRLAGIEDSGDPSGTTDTSNLDNH